jgi:hypothetical protein
MNKYLEKIAETIERRKTPAEHVIRASGTALGAFGGLVGGTLAQSKMPVHQLSRKADVLARRAERKARGYVQTVNNVKETRRAHQYALDNYVANTKNKRFAETLHEANRAHQSAVFKRMGESLHVNKVGAKAYENSMKRLGRIQKGIMLGGAVAGGLAGDYLAKDKSYKPK